MPGGHGPLSHEQGQLEVGLGFGVKGSGFQESGMSTNSRYYQATILGKIGHLFVGEGRRVVLGRIQ